MSEITNKQIESLILEANANQNKSLDSFLYYKQRKQIVYDFIARMPAFNLESVLRPISRNLRDQIMFEVQAYLVFTNRTFRCAHTWVSFKSDGKKACSLCYTIEDL